MTFGNYIRSQPLNRLYLIRSTRTTFNVSKLYKTKRPEAVYTRDVYGLRGTFQAPSEIDILTVGGSTTDQRYIRDGETWQDIFQKEMNIDGKSIVVGNAGVDGQSSFGHIKNFDWWFPYVPGLKPKYVLFYVGLNDFYKDENYSFDKLRLQDKSVLWYLLKTLKGIYKAIFVMKISHRHTDFDKMEWVSQPLQKNYDELMQHRLSAYEKRLDVLVEKTLALGAIPIFMTQPPRRYRFENKTLMGCKETLDYDGHQINGVDFYYMMKKLNQVTLQKSKEHQCLGLNLADEIVWIDEDFYDFAHMTPQGTQKIGDYLFQKLKTFFPSRRN